MTYWPTTSIKAADSPSIDAFDRLRVSSPITLFDNQQSYGDNGAIWENSTSGGGTTSNRLAESAVRMTTGNTTSGSKCVRSSRQYHRYQPGKSQLVLITFCLGPMVANGRQRVGYFDALNGVFLERTNAGVVLVQRTGITGVLDDSVQAAQSAWNIDRMDGSGGAANPSGITINWNYTQILVLDLQWLGVGRVRCGVVQDGIVHYVHQFLNTNIRSTVYMTSACLPLRFEVENTGTTAAAITLDHICSAVLSEGGFEGSLGPQFAASNGTAAISVNTRRPILTVRARTAGPNSVRNTGQIVPKDWEVMNTGTTNPVFYELVVNGALTGSPSWTAVDSARSIAEFDVAASGISGGTIIASGFAPNAAKASAASGASFYRDFPLVYSSLLNVQDTLSLVCTGIGGATTTLGAMTWQEQF